MEGEEARRRESVTVKDEQISLLKAVLVQLNEELQKKEERIADLELQLTQALRAGCQDDSSDSHTPFGVSVLSKRSEFRCSLVARGNEWGLPRFPRQPTAGDGTQPLPHRGGRDGVFGQLGNDDNGSVAGGNRRSGNHSNKTTPTRRRKLSVLDREQQELQGRIATLDSTIAELELGGAGEERVGGLRRERSRVMGELNTTVQSRLRKVRRNSDDVFARLATDYESFSKDQMCEAVRELDRAQARYKTYIDQLLAVVLETNSALLEGMPRLQQSSGLRLDLLRMASRGELFEDVQERERNMASLESYATQLSERLMTHSSPLLPLLDPFPNTGDGMESGTTLTDQQHQQVNSMT